MVNKVDKKISITIVSVFVILSIQYFLLVFFNIFGSGLTNTIQLASKMIVGISFLSAFPLIIKYNFFKLFSVYIFFVLLYLFTFVFFPNNKYALLENSFEVFFISVPLFVYSLSISDLNVLKRTFKIGSIIILIFSIFTTLIVLFLKKNIGNYSMALSYYTLIPALFYLDDFFSKYQLKSLFMLFISLLIILIIGARGPLLPILFYGVIRFFNSNSNVGLKAKVIKTLIIIFPILLILFFEDIILFLINILNKIGWSSRTLKLLLESDIYLSGRGNIYRSAWDLIINGPILGYGLFSDRVFFGIYAHNIILEFSLHFGLFLGLFIFLFIIVLVVVCYFRDKNNLILFLFSSSIIPLMVSGSYIIDMMFWILLGVCIRIFFMNKTGVKYSIKTIR